MGGDLYHPALILVTTDGGAHWATQASGTTDTALLSVAFTDALHGWAGGYNGLILATSDGGAHWATQTTGVANVYWLTFTDADHGWAACGYGSLGAKNAVILSTSDGGAHWTGQESNTAYHANLLSVAFADAADGWAVGKDGAIVATTDGGATWAPEASGTTQQLNSVAFTDADNGWAVGYAGTIIATTDGGATWTSKASGTANDLWAVDFASASQGWAAGTLGTIVAYGAGATPVKLATTTKLSGPAGARVNKTFQLTGTVSPSAATGRVTIVKTRLVGAKWKAAGSTKVTLSGGAFSCSVKPTAKGSWRFVASYPGSTAGSMTYKASRSAVKNVRVK